MNNYNPAKIYQNKTGKKEWYIYYEYRYPPGMKPENAKSDFKGFKKRLGINRFRNPKDRKKAAENARDAQNILLSQGFNPFATKEQIMSAPQPVNILQEMTFTEALKWALDKKIQKKGLASRTINDRHSMIEIIKIGALLCGMDVKVTQITRFQVLTILDKIQQTRKFSNVRYNAFLETIKTLMTELVRWDVIPFSPAAVLEYLPKEAPHTHIPQTGDELKLISEHLQKVNYPFYLYTKLLIKTGCRPKEALSLRVGWLNIEKEVFVIPPGREFTKNAKGRKLPIDTDLMNAIVNHTMKAQDSDYVFSKNFIPGPFEIHRNIASNTWRRLVKVGLGINKTMYALKHTLAQLILENGGSLEDVQNILGHGSTKMSRIYTLDKEKEISFEKIKRINVKF